MAKRRRIRRRRLEVRCVDCRDGMAGMPTASVDYILTDPPYGLEFMGKGWDKGVPGVEFWEAALRVAKPGAMMMAFGGTRTHHRLACAIEDAGWEIRDCLMWLYGTGFPKSLNIGKKTEGWDGWGTALKPAWEPIILAMKPCDGTFAENALAHGVAGLNVDGARVGIDANERETIDSRSGVGFGTGVTVGAHQGRAEGRFTSHDAGRWPANLILDEEAGALLDEQSGELHGHGSARHGGSKKGLFDWGKGERPQTGGDTGGASRFFYCAKASRRERNEGLPEGTKNKHPTVKPLALMRYLLTLLSSPTGGVVLDPFAGSGSTGVACALEGREFAGFEIEQASADTANARIAHARRVYVER